MDGPDRSRGNVRNAGRQRLRLGSDRRQPGCYDFRVLLLPVLAAAGIHFTGHAYEIFYSGKCDPGPVLTGRPAIGRRIVARPGVVNSNAKAVAEATVAPDGTYDMTIAGAGDFCIVPESGYNPTGPCLVTFRGAIEGTRQEDLRFAALDGKPPPSCPKVLGEVVRVIDPCGDDGRPPEPLAGVIVQATSKTSTRAGTIATGPGGQYTTMLAPGQYCFRVERESDAYLPAVCRTGCDATVDVTGEADIRARVVAHQTCGNTCVSTAFKPEVPTALGVARVAAKGGTHHVRGLAFTPNQPAYGCGALHAAVPPRPRPGALVSVLALDNDPAAPPVAQVYTDASGFDIALPTGMFCLRVEPSSDRSCQYIAKITATTPTIDNVKLVPPTPPRPPCPPGVP